ncbi:aldo/keto reductase [Amycolatopsis sp. lyj-90]|uniref:aldo/keto reductase n=1 Tax=Amycolatopsis sp. lyj-90 TaxID=2789285 RepID=UPI00397BC9A8
MEKRKFSGGAVEVSRLGLGTSTWGRRGSEDDSAAQLRLFADAGGTLIETANVYGNGGSETMIGELLSTVFTRADFVLATKAGLVPGKPPLKTDASAERLLTELEGSLRRLRTDHVELWQVHAWDYAVPIEETLRAVDTAIFSGKAIAVGVCNYCGWQTAEAATVQQLRGQAPLATAEVEYSLLQRGIEREVVPAAHEFGIDIMPWAPLGRGVLTGKYASGIRAANRESKFFRWYVEKYATDERCATIVQEVLRCARELEVSPPAIALSWVRDRPRVVAPLVGARTAEQLAESLESESLVLPGEIRQRLDAVSEIPITYPEHRI